MKAKQFEDNVVGGAPRTSWQAPQLDPTQESCVKHMCAWKQAYASASDEKNCKPQDSELLCRLPNIPESPEPIFSAKGRQRSLPLGLAQSVVLRPLWPGG